MTCRVLVVDDDDAVRLVAQEMLLTLNCEVTGAISGEAALAVLEPKPIDLVFLDVGMPVMNGVEVYKRIRNKLPNQKVAFITGYAKEDLTEFLDAYTWVVAKSFTIEPLASAIERVNN